MYNRAGDYNVPMKILIPTEKIYNAQKSKVYPDPNTVSDDFLFFGSFKTFGGTESTVNGTYAIINTANVETFYRPDITSAARIVLLESGEIYEIMGTPEDIERRHQILKFKVKRITGGA